MHENFKEVSEEEFLAHFGVPGMKWGKRKAKTSSASKPLSRRSQKKAARKKRLDSMTEDERATYDLKRAVVGLGAAVAAHTAMQAGAQWALRNPQKINKFFDKAKGMANKQKAITKGYTIIKASMGANGTWKV